MIDFKHGSLFSGIGGFDLAAEWMGWENMFHCEISPFCKQLLNYYWPNAQSFDDIKKTDFTIFRGRIDILTGGFPCQPYSQAGKRKGKEDERHLWPEMLRAIREIQPRWIVGENVFGLINWNGGLVFDEVQADLEAAGYEVWAYVLPACAVDAPHRRDRIWFVAHTNSKNSNGRSGNIKREWQEDGQFGPRMERSVARYGEEWPTTDPFSEQCALPVQQRRQDEAQDVNPDWKGAVGIIAYTIGIGSGESVGRKQSEQLNEDGQAGRISSDADGFRLRGESNRFGRPGQFGENEPGNYWQNWPTQSPVCNGDDGLSGRLDGITFSKWRNESMKGGGNAIVPPLVYQIFKTIEQYELDLSVTHSLL